MSPGAALAVGVHLSVEGHVSDTLNLRSSLEGNVGLNRLPEVRLDLTLLHHAGRVYYGGGVGSGLVADFGSNESGLPGIVFSPITMLNAHAVLGWDLGSSRLEGVLRLGPEHALEVRAIFPLN
ncbi:hypothetical protein [Deinococcus sonorensis]|uniref:Uncharacterized protein n=2 Tax=Deinococcus sonorensis TaxID=309891 RepID=A0AAU7U745_9DEIO